MAGIKTVFFL